MTLADAITIARAFATIPIALAIAADARPLALLLFGIAAASDAADGWVARRSHDASARGALLDPLADKILVIGTLVALSAAGRGWPVTLVAVALGGREVLVAILRLRAFARGRALDADAIAKAKTALELIGIVAVIVGTRPWAVVGAGVVGVALLVSVATLPRYVRSARSADR